MIAEHLIQLDLTPSQLSETVGDILSKMEEYGVNHWPIVDGERYVGLMSEDLALDQDESLLLSELSHQMLKSSLTFDRHILDAVRKYGDERLTILPIVDHEDMYLGYILPQDILRAVGGLFSIQAPGSILVLETNQFDYSLSQISQIVESNDAKILASYIHAHTEKGIFEVTIRINFTDLSAIIAGFRRYNYKIVNAWHENRYEQDLKQRFDQFINYLNM